MDSYQQLRKMAEISKSLKKHGLVSDDDSAMKSAEDVVLGRGGHSIYVSKDKLEKEPQLDEKPSDSKGNAQKSSQSNIDASAIQNCTNRIDSLDSQMGIMRTKMNEIIAKLNELESKMQNQPRHEVQATLSSESSSKNNESTQSAGVESKSSPDISKKDENKNKVVPEVKKEYNSDDVAVDKIFYAGNKR